MRVGWRKFLLQRFKKPSSYFSVGIELSADSARVSVLKQKGAELHWVLQTHFATDDWRESLARFVSQHRLANTPCNVALSSGRYQLLQVDRPQVPGNEIVQALGWTMRDLVSIQGELVVDYFDLPAQSTGSHKINAIAVSRDEIEGICETVMHAGLELKSIGIAELATCDLLGNSEEAVMTLLQQPGDEIYLNIIKDGQLYFSRRLRGYENLSTFTEAELQMGIGDNLSVEIRRSMDYFESQLKQAPVKKIILGLDSGYLTQLTEMLRQLTFMPVEPMQAVPGDVQQTLDCYSYISVGAAFARQNGDSGEKQG